MRILLAAVALLLVLPAAAQVPTPNPAVPNPPPPPSTDPVTPRLEVTFVGLQGAVPDLRDGVPSKGHVLATIRNTGPVEVATYTVGYQWQARDGTLTWLNFDDETQSTDTNTHPAGTNNQPGNGTLEPGESRDLPPMPWTPIPAQAGPGRIVVTVTYSSQSSSLTSPDPPYFVASHDLRLLLPATPALNLSAQETRFLRATLRNAGNLDEAVTLNVTDWDRGNGTRLRTQWLPGKQFTAPAGRTVAADLLVTYPFSGDVGNFTANYTVRATSATPGYRQLFAKTPLIRARDCCATAGHAFTAENQAPDALAVRGGTLRVPLRVANAAPAGSGRPDTYQVMAIPPDGWAAVVDTPRLALVEGEAKSVNVTFTVPGNAVLGSTHVLPIRVRSDHDGGERELPTRVQVRGAAPVVRSLHVDGNWLYVGDEARGAARVENPGTEDYPAPSLLRVTATLPKGEPAATNVASLTLNVTVPPIPAGATVEVPFLLGRLAWPGRGVATAAWREGSGGASGAAAEASFRVQRYDIQLRAPPGPLSGQPGETVHYQSLAQAFRLTNNGTGTEAVRVAAFAAVGRATLGASVIELAPQATVSIPLSQTLPLPAGSARNVTVTVVATQPDRPDLVASASVATLVADRRPPTIRLDPLPANWTVGQPLPLRVHVEDDGAVAAVRVIQRLPPGNATAHLLRRDPAGDWVGNLTFAARGDHEVRLNATDAAGNVARTQATVVHAESYAPPRLAALPAPAGPATRATVLRIQVSSAHPLASLTARVGGGNAVPLTLDNGTATLRLADLPGLRAGAQVVTVEAVDAVGARATLAVPVDLQEAAAPATPTTTAPARSTPPAGMAAALGVLITASFAVRRVLRRR